MGVEMIIFCIGCNANVDGRITTVEEIYPHRKDLYHLNFYKCDACKNYVGTHKETSLPLGHISTHKISLMRRRIHGYLDPLWKKGKICRAEAYRALSEEMGFSFHTALLKNEEECIKALNFVLKIKEKLK